MAGTAVTLGFCRQTLSKRLMNEEVGEGSYELQAPMSMIILTKWPK